jgi:hypothetical protein
MAQPNPNIEMSPIVALRPYSGNARRHSRKQVRQIADSIQRFGFTNPVLISDEDEIIAGHGRVMATKELGIATVPTLRLSHLAEAAALAGDRDHSLPQSAIIWTRGLISDAHAAAADGFTRPPLAHRVMLHVMRDGLPLRGRRHHFFTSRSFSATLSSIASASIRFSLAFSSSSVRRRLASDTSIPPNFAFHL